MKPETPSSAQRPGIGQTPPLRALALVEDSLMALLVFSIFCVVLAGILSRFVFHVSLSWTTEVAVTVMIWMTFLGIAMGARDRAHVSFELLEDKLEGKALMALAFLQLILMGFLLVVLAWGGWEFTKLGMEQLTPAGIPQWVSFAAVPFGSALGMVHLLAIAWDIATGVQFAPAHAPTEAGAA